MFNRMMVAVAIVLFLAAGAPAEEGRQIEDQKLSAPDGSRNDAFGSGVSVCGDVAMIGAYHDKDNGINSGSAYVFRRDPASGTWKPEAKLLASDGAFTDEFGYSVSIFDDVALIGAPGVSDHGTSSGAAYVFRYDAGSAAWVEETKILFTPGGGYEHYGESVSLSGDIALIGGVNPQDGKGLAWVYRYDPGSGAWNFDAKLKHPESDSFACSVSVCGETLIVGADDDDDNGNSAGAAYVYRYDPGSGDWIDEAKLLASDGAVADYFGCAVSLAGDVALIGARGVDGNGPNSGAVYVFRYDPGSGTWNEEAKLHSSDSASNEQFGKAVSVSGNIALIGVPKGHHGNNYWTGSAYVFEYEPATGQWLQKGKLLASDRAEYDLFGASVSVAGEVALVGAPADDHPGQDYGSVCVFTPPPTLDIKCNGQDDDVVVQANDNVKLTIDIDAGDHAGELFDVWVLAANNSGHRWSYGLAGSGPLWCRGWCTAYLSGPLCNVSETVHDRPLPLRVYKAWLAVDKRPNGNLNTPDVLIYDAVKFRVVP